MIYLPEEIIGYIISFFVEEITVSTVSFLMDYHTTEIKTLKHKSIEKLFLSLTCKDLNGVVKKYSNESKLTIYSVREYYYDSMFNMNMIHELESLNMCILPYDNDNYKYFWLKISENPELFKYLHYNTLHYMWIYIHRRYKYEIILNLDIVEYLLSEIKNEELILFLQCLKDDFIKLKNARDIWEIKDIVIHSLIFNRFIKKSDIESINDDDDNIPDL